MRMSAAELGDNLAQLVWESFSDFIERRGLGAHQEGEDEGGTAVLALPTVEPEEALIFFMWLHTRACQQACDDPESLKKVLDAMHRAIYEDLEARTFTRVQLPLFEQRVSARYTEYYDAAADRSGEKVVEVAARHVLVNGMRRPAVTLELAEAATVTSGPLRDFLEDLELTD